ncbi:MAG TPA: glycosyltransferase family 4 protein, partial [Burkholderiales bacterium]
VLLYTSQFPTPNDPNGGVFTAQLADAMAARADVEVVCPLPWCPDVGWTRRHPAWRLFVNVPRALLRGSIPVHYPRFPLVPKVSGAAQPYLQALAAYPLVARLHRARPIDVIHGHWVYPDGVAATMIARRLGVPVVLTALGSDINVYGELKLRRRQIGWALARARAVTGVSRALVDKVIGLGAPAARAHYVPNGIDGARFRVPTPVERLEARARLGLDPDRRYLLFLGRLHAVKGLPVLLRALASLAAAGHLGFDTLLVGDGAERPALEAESSRLGLKSRVRFAGERPHREVPQWLCAADALCLPSLMEGMPNVVLEAAATGLPVVASAVGAVPDIVSPETGILVPPGDAEALARSLHEVFDRSWRREEVARASPALSWDAVAERYLAILSANEKPELNRAA